MTEAVAQSGKSTNVASSTPETMEWDSRARRVVMIYLPLSCFVIILLFPFYWMAITSFKPNAELLNFKDHNPFWITSLPGSLPFWDHHLSGSTNTETTHKETNHVTNEN